MPDQDGPTQSCGNCRFYRESLCMRYPQEVGKEPEDWCGCWEMADVPYPAPPESDATEAMENALGLEG